MKLLAGLAALAGLAQSIKLDCLEIPSTQFKFYLSDNEVASRLGLSAADGKNIKDFAYQNSKYNDWGTFVAQDGGTIKYQRKRYSFIVYEVCVPVQQAVPVACAVVTRPNGYGDQYKFYLDDAALAKGMNISAADAAKIRTQAVNTKYNDWDTFNTDLGGSIKFVRKFHSFVVHEMCAPVQAAPVACAVVTRPNGFGDQYQFYLDDAALAKGMQISAADAAKIRAQALKTNYNDWNTFNTDQGGSIKYIRKSHSFVVHEICT